MHQNERVRAKEKRMEAVETVAQQEWEEKADRLTGTKMPALAVVEIPTGLASAPRS